MERIVTSGRNLLLSVTGMLKKYPHLYKLKSQGKNNRTVIRFATCANRMQFTETSMVNIPNRATIYNSLNQSSKKIDTLYPDSYWFPVTKRLFDILFSLAVIIFILSWLFPILFIIIKLESEGSALFVQNRSGRDNKSFKCYKFRSMYINKECDTAQTPKGDPRITKIGAFLRRTSLDELPQFFNVLFGDMSVVGPRPHMVCQTRHYAQLIDTFMVRHFIKPGITGWAQVNGMRGEVISVTEMLNRVDADVWYIKNWSFLLDLQIVIRTALKTIGGDKNAF